MKHCFFLLLPLLHLMVQSSAGSRRPILTAKRSVAVTGSYTVVLRNDVSEQEFEAVLKKATKLSSEKQLHAIIRRVEKSFTARLSQYSLEIVSERLLYFPCESWANFALALATSAAGFD